MIKKLKSLILNDQFFFSILVILVGVISFTLGYLARGEVSMKKPSPIVLPAAVIEATPTDTVSDNGKPVPISNQAGKYVGSKSGSKYHLTTCPGAKQIKDSNKIYFDSVDAALAAGYKPAANCPELQ